jgi:hypothetical protein
MAQCADRIDAHCPEGGDQTYAAGYGESIWSSDRDGDLGTGGYQAVRLSPGKHRLTVRRGPCGERLPAGVVEVIDR